MTDTSFSDRTTVAEPAAPARPITAHADALAGAVFGTWTVAGLFVDGWAHNAGKPESFWTPWHLLLYSGFVCGTLWLGIARSLRVRRGEAVEPMDRATVAGFVLFAGSGVADMIWHSVFGIESGIAALLSPSHLMLMGAGLLVLGTPVRAAVGAGDESGGPSGRGAESSWRTFLPVAVGLTLSVGVVSFFLQFSNALVAVPEWIDGGGGNHISGIMAVLTANAVLVGALVWTDQRWPRTPTATYTVMFTAVAVAMAGLRGYGAPVLIVPVAAAGVLADVLVARGTSSATVAVAVPGVLWSLWFATFHAAFGLDWEPELWSGTIVLAMLSGYALVSLAGPSGGGSGEAGQPAAATAVPTDR